MDLYCSEVHSTLASTSLTLAQSVILQSSNPGSRKIGWRKKGVEKNAMEWQGGKNHANGLQPSWDDGCDEERNPMNIIFYLVKVISLVFLDSLQTPRIPRIRKIHTRL